MFWYVLIGFFAAVGFLCLLWLIFGAFLPAAAPAEVAVLCRRGREQAILRRYRWLRDLGLTRCRLIMLNSQLPQAQQRALTEHFPGVKFCTLEEWDKIMKERTEKDG